MHSGLNTMPMNQPGNPSSSIGPWNHPFDQNEQTPFNWDQWFQQNPYHGQWPNHLGYGYHNQQNTLVQQNPSGQQSILDWMNNPSSSTTHDEHYRGNHKQSITINQLQSINYNQSIIINYIYSYFRSTKSSSYSKWARS